MSTENSIQDFVIGMDSTEKVYAFFERLGYKPPVLLSPAYRPVLNTLELRQEHRANIRDAHTVLNFDREMHVFFFEAKTLTLSFVKYITKKFSDSYLKLLLVFTADFKEYTFVLPETVSLGAGEQKLKMTILAFDRTGLYHTDIQTLAGLAFTPDEKSNREIWQKWRKAFSVKKVTDGFFEDYKKAFLMIRDLAVRQKVPVKTGHDFSHQLLSRIMFIYFIAKKRWLDNNPKFLGWFWGRYKDEKRKGKMPDNSFYDKWLTVLFLEAFNKQFSHPAYLPADITAILQLAPYLNGGLFRRNKIDDLPVSINDNEFETVFAFFEKYNFTIREELPLEVEVAVDPQMLGYVYESLANVAEEIYERQDFGIFYTPPAEVDFMCRRSLVEYLAGRIPELPKENVYQLLFDENTEKIEDFITAKKFWYRIEEALDDLAVVDPACGSGAFLVGMLNTIARLYRICYRHISRQMTDYQLKKKIIGNSLYGVDVMPWAVHSAELRLWLQLIIESDLKVAELQLSPLLPNLTLRLRIGDSLVQEIGGMNLRMRDSSLSIGIKRKLSALKAEKEKYYNNDPTAKFKNDQSVLQEEIRVFGEALDERVVNLQKEIQSVSGKTKDVSVPMILFDSAKPDYGKAKVDEKIKGLEQEIKPIEQEIKQLKEIRRKIQEPEQKPFVWDIDFAEIFGDKGGFDIVIGNPPYVRQEKIAPPNKTKEDMTPEIRRGYKEKLLSSVQAHFPFIKALDQKSDYYIYFYFHGLALLNEKGTFCFITSNSWLDVGYGKDLQEFLLKNCHIKAIYDNEAKRSFEHADVNTIIALFGSPQVTAASRNEPILLPGSKAGLAKSDTANLALNETARFIMFKKPFEEAVNTKNLLAIETAEAIHKTDAYRVYPIKQETLLDEGLEHGADEPEATPVNAKKALLDKKGITGRYEANKWGGKYLKMSDSLISILKRLQGQIVPLDKLLSYDYGLKPGVVDFFYLNEERIEKYGIESHFYRPVINSSRSIDGYIARSNAFIFWCHESLKELSGTGARKYIEWGVSQKYNNVTSVKGHRPFWYSLNSEPADCILLQFWDKRFWTPRVKDMIFVSNNFYYGKLIKQNDEVLLAMLNSILFFLQIECYGRTNLGLGVLTTYGPDFATIRMPFPDSLDLLHRQRIVEAYRALCTLEVVSIDKDVKRKERRELDEALLSGLCINPNVLDELYEDLVRMVFNRIKKAGFTGKRNTANETF